MDLTSGLPLKSGTDNWTVPGYMTMVIFICCMLVRLLAVWRKSRWAAEATSRATQTIDAFLEQCHSNVRQTFMTTRYSDAVHCRHDCQFLLKKHSLCALSWCTYCDPTLRQSAIGGGALGCENMF